MPVPAITITLIDTPTGVSVRTDATRPVVGRCTSPAEALAIDLLRDCTHRATEVRYGPDSVPCIALLRDILSPEGYGHAVTPEVRRAVHRVLDGGLA